MKKIIDIVKLLIQLVRKKSNKVVFVKYFHEVVNVGDILNVDLMEFYTKKKVVNPKGCSRFKHYLVVGSIIHNMNKNSTVIGSGLISPEYIDRINQLGNIKAVRGELTKRALERKFQVDLSDIPLGDPALLFPRIYRPLIEKKFKMGIVLHYVDENHPIKEIFKQMDGKIISVKQSPRHFIDDIIECENIISSSMHGLILSDAYEIPNKRIVLSKHITGGDFKFKDYYSTTNTPDECYATINENVTIDDIRDVINNCTVKHFIGDINMLEKAFTDE